MRGGEYADVLPVLQVPDNKADAVSCDKDVKKVEKSRLAKQTAKEKWVLNDLKTLKPFSWKKVKHIYRPRHSLS